MYKIIKATAKEKEYLLEWLASLVESANKYEKTRKRIEDYAEENPIFEDVGACTTFTAFRSDKVSKIHLCNVPKIAEILGLPVMVDATTYPGEHIVASIKVDCDALKPPIKHLKGILKDVTFFSLEDWDAEF